MLFTRVRERPHIACARGLSSRLASTMVCPSWDGMISSARVQASWPLGPFTVTVCPAIVTWTPAGIATGFLPIRDILVDPADDFAAHVRLTGGRVGHDALGRRQDRDPEA